MFSIATDLYTPQALAEEMSRIAVTNGQSVSSLPANTATEEAKNEEAVRVSISPEAAQLLAQVEGENLPVTAAEAENETTDEQKSPSGKSTSTPAPPSPPTADSNELTAAEKDMVQRLAARDQEVRAHERDHLAAAGELAVGGAQYTYEKGPDGKLYAIGGHVNINTGTESDPAKAKLKAARVRSAALASGDASAADAAVAAHAGAILGNTIAPEEEESLSTLALKIRTTYNPRHDDQTGQNLDTLVT